VDLHPAAQRRESFMDAEQAESASVFTGGRLRIKTAAVVLDGQENSSIARADFHGDEMSPGMFGGVEPQFSACLQAQGPQIGIQAWFVCRGVDNFLVGGLQLFVGRIHPFLGIRADAG
jgi:hypothetical protein